MKWRKWRRDKREEKSIVGILECSLPDCPEVEWKGSEERSQHIPVQRRDKTNHQHLSFTLKHFEGDAALKARVEIIIDDREECSRSLTASCQHKSSYLYLTWAVNAPNIFLHRSHFLKKELKKSLAKGLKADDRKLDEKRPETYRSYWGFWETKIVMTERMRLQPRVTEVGFQL